jgi:hypothetical protein
MSETSTTKPGFSVFSATPAQSFLNQCHELISEELAPANLEERIVFRAPTKSSSNAGSKRNRSEGEQSAKRTKIAGVKNTKLLSFDQEDGDDS